MEAFLVSTGAVALAEIGDKTQLLSLLLVARWRRPWPIAFGVLLATLANHGATAALGAWGGGFVDERWQRWIVGAAFLAVALWALFPDRLESEPEAVPRRALGVLLATAAAFFVAEMGDKTQVATLVLAAEHDSVLAVTAGTTLGMMLANVPAIAFGERLCRRLPLRPIRLAACALFAALGIAALAGWP